MLDMWPAVAMQGSEHTDPAPFSFPLASVCKYEAGLGELSLGVLALPARD